jgi:hypothetical protein
VSLLSATLIVIALGLAVALRQWRQAEDSRRQLDFERYREVLAQVESLVAADKVTDAEGLLNAVAEAEPLLDSCPPSVRGWEWHFLKGLQGGQRFTLRDGSLTQEQHGLGSGGDVVDHSTCCVGINGNHLVHYSYERSLVTVWDVESGKEVSSTKVEADRLDNTTLSPDGRLLGSSPGPEFSRRWALPFDRVWNVHGRISIWDTEDKKVIQSLTLYPNVAPDQPRFATTACAPLIFSPDGKRFAAISEAGTGGTGPQLVVWDVTTGNELLREPLNSLIHCLAFSPDNQCLAAFYRFSSWDLGEPASDACKSKLVVWDLQAPDKPLFLARNVGRVRCMAFSRDGRSLSTAIEDPVDISGKSERREVIKAWDVNSGQESFSHSVPTLQSVSGMAYSPDGSRLLTAGSSGEVTVLDAGTGQKMISFLLGKEGIGRNSLLWRHPQLVFSPGGERLAIVGGGIVTVLPSPPIPHTATSLARWLRRLTSASMMLLILAAMGVLVRRRLRRRSSKIQRPTGEGPSPEVTASVTDPVPPGG